MNYGLILNQTFIYIEGYYIDGFGKISCGELEIYVGSFRNGIFEGQGRLINSSWLKINTQLPFVEWVSYSG